MTNNKPQTTVNNEVINTEEALKDCPFCGGEAMIETHRYTNPSGSEWGWSDYFAVYCKTCYMGSSTQSHHYKSLGQLTKYSWKEFKANPALRVDEEYTHEQHVKSVREKAIKAWNTRTPDPRHIKQEGTSPSAAAYEELVGFVKECTGDIRLVGDREAECEPTELATKAGELIKQIEELTNER